MKLAAMLNQDFQNALLALGNEKVSMPTAYRLKKLVNQINQELGTYNELLAKIQDKHKPVEEGKEVDQQAFMKDYLELVNMEIETPKIKLSELQNVSLTTKDLVILDPVLQDDSEAQA
jgi:hypothetical protein